MKAIDRSGLMRLACYLVLMVCLYLVSHLVSDLVQRHVRPSAWLALNEANVTIISIGLIVVGLRWVNTLNESSEP